MWYSRTLVCSRGLIGYQGAKARLVHVRIRRTHGLDNKQRIRPWAMSDVVEIGSLAYV
jgi:hypothetical protein